MKQRAALKQQQKSAEEEVLEIEAASRRASLDDDNEFFERVAVDDFQSIDPMGTIRAKAEMLARRRAGVVKFHAMPVEDEHVRLYGSAAVVTGVAHIEAEHEHSSISGSYRFTRVYVKQLGRWRVVSSHSTRIAAASAISRAENARNS